jgi:hypothetical protein
MFSIAFVPSLERIEVFWNWECPSHLRDEKKPFSGIMVKVVGAFASNAPSQVR